MHTGYAARGGCYVEHAVAQLMLGHAGGLSHGRAAGRAPNAALQRADVRWRRQSATAGDAHALATQSNTSTQRTTRFWLIGILAAVVLLVIVVVGIVAQNDTAPETMPVPSASGAPNAGEQSEAPQLSQLARRDPADAAAMGSIDAPVVLIEYADFRCAYCAVFANEVMPQIVSKYVESGQLRVEWRDAPVLGNTSPDAAIAAHAAGAQGLFWPYAEALYAASPTSKTEWTRDALVSVAGTVPGLDVAAFTVALDDPAHAQRVAREAQETASIGVTSTPTFVVGNQAVRGAQPIEAFREVIEQELAAAKL